MFGKKSKEQDKAKELEEKIEDLQRERDKLKEEVADLKLEKKTGEEDLKHMVKIKEEKDEVRFQQKMLEIERKQQAAIADVKDKYRDKMETQLSQETNNIKEMYAQILERLPNYNVTVKQNKW